MCEIYSNKDVKTIKTSERRLVNFEQISEQCFAFSILDFEQVNTG